MEIVKMTAAHHDDVRRMSEIFYNSDAVDHDVPAESIEKNIAEATGDNPYFTGYVLAEDGENVGYSYVSQYYETEIGGMCVMIIDLYIDEKCRGRGFGTQLFNFVFKEYSHAKRFRLEVERDNENAVALYKKLGFKELGYMQMIIEK